jgi:pyruvate dehydrogenase E1 component
MLSSPEVRSETTVLRAVESRVLWLATSIIHHANAVRHNRSGLKVGGHQASSASAVSILTALYFRHLRAADRVSIKPHASPVLHAIEYLLGKLDRAYLPTLRAYGGLQSYPSRSRDPVPADFSTGSVGIGATATIWSALAHRYVAGHFEVPTGGRQVALVGDAELDEGVIWEAIVDPLVPRLGEVLWIVDLNRQSLDRVVPEMSVRRIERMFDAAGWEVQVVKYGRLLEGLFAGPHGDALRRRIDQMTNDEYQRLLRSPVAEVRAGIVGSNADAAEIGRVLADLDDEGVARALRDLGGHDLDELEAAYARADEARDRPSLIIAYTHKAWRLPTEGHPANHSALLKEPEWRALAAMLGADPDDPWAPFDDESAEALLCRDAATRLERPAIRATEPPSVPEDFGGDHRGAVSTQAAFGRFFLELSRTAGDVAERVVTVSPDVASSTSLGGWINRAGTWHMGERVDWFANDPETILHWRESPNGRHIELGIAECNLVGLLGELGATWSRDGEPLLPIGTLYDPFVNRALEPWSYGIYAGGQSILVGTPSGVTLAPEGGAHQSIITPSVGLEQPKCIAWEPAFAQDLEWTLLHALALLGRKGGTSSYFRLSTRTIAQSLAAVPDGPERKVRRNQVVRGAYALQRAQSAPSVTLVGMGAVMPNVFEAAATLAADGTSVDVLCLTSADLVFRALQARNGLGDHDVSILDEVWPAERAAPMVAVLDGHPHTLSFLGNIWGQPIVSLGVTDFGESGDIDDLHEHFDIDPDTIIGIAIDAARHS